MCSVDISTSNLCLKLFYNLDVPRYPRHISADHEAICDTPAPFYVEI
jgi:hypothetical protein